MPPSAGRTSMSDLDRPPSPPKSTPAQPSATPAAEPQQAADDVPSASQQTNNSYPSNARRPAARKATLFGIPQPSAPPLNVNPNFDDDNYETRFPPDPLYEEVSSPNARVYRVYIEESAKYDAYMTDEAREGLDVLLVFAGLFSAVLTTFVAQTSQSLQPDRATETTLLLREVAALQRAQISGASIDSIPSTSANFVPSSLDVWVNGLWFTSLTLSLICALLAVLMKQWIRHYTSFVSGTAKERSLIRQYRFMGLQQWHVPTLIGILPVLMHLSLAIFLVGLTLFLVPLRLSIASIVGSLSALIFVAYVTTAVWPLFRIQCPYRTPLSTIVHDIAFPLRKYVLRNYGADYVSLKEQEHENATAWTEDTLVVHAFEWLLTMSSNPSVHRVVAQSIGGLSRPSSSTQRLCNNLPLECTWRGMFHHAFSRSPEGRCILPEQVDLLDRLFRTALHQDSSSFFLRGLDSDVWSAIQLHPAPTLQWESAAIAVVWHSRCGERDRDLKDPVLAQRAYAVVRHLMSEPLGDETQLPVMVWEHLLAAASSCPSTLHPDLSDSAYTLDQMIVEELTSYLRNGWVPVGLFGDVSPISLREALSRQSENFFWFLLSPFDKHQGGALDSSRLQGLLSLVNAIVSHGLCAVSREIFFGTCRELVGELCAGSVTLKDREAICDAAYALLQAKLVFQDDDEDDDFGRTAILLPSLLFLHCRNPHITSCSAATRNMFVNLVDIDMFQVVLHEFHIAHEYLWNWLPLLPGKYVTQVASLIASLVRTSLDLWTGAGAQPEDSRWLEYLCLPANSATIVFLFALSGTTQTPASVAQVRNDLLLFFSRAPLESTSLRECKTTLDQYLARFPRFQALSPDPLVHDRMMKEAEKVIDELISEQTPKPANLFNRYLRRSGKSVDPEANS